MERTLQILLDHNAWATRKMIESCAKLSPEQFHQRFDIGPGSLHDTLVHIVGAMLRWSDRIGQRTLRDSPEKRQEPWSIEELLALLDQAAADLRRVAEEVCRAGGLDVQIEFKLPEAEPLHFSKGAALVHVTTHGMHHRAQALNMLRQMGVIDLVDQIDALDWALARENRGR